MKQRYNFDTHNPTTVLICDVKAEKKVEKMKSYKSTPVSAKTTENMHVGAQGARWSQTRVW